MGARTIAELHERIQRIQNHPKPLHAILRFQEILQASWRREFSARHDEWTKQNPALGQDGPTALLVQEKFGGEILCAVIAKNVKYCWNRIGGQDVHFASAQLAERDIGALVGTLIRREELLAADDGKMETRYELICLHFDFVERSLAAYEQQNASQPHPSST